MRAYYALGSRILMQGKRGRDVELIQHWLRQMSFPGKEEVSENGRFETGLCRNIQALQRYFQEQADGIVGRDTYRLLGLEVDEYWQSAFPPLGMRVLRREMQGRDVLILQNRLASFREKYACRMRREKPGYLGRETEKALRCFQRDCGLKPTGILDEKSCLMLYYFTGLGSRRLQRGCKGHDRGYDVFCLQEQLRKKGFLRGKAHGIFDRETENAVRSLQKSGGLLPSGTVGRKTFFLLGL